MSSDFSPDSVFARQAQIYDYVQNGVVDVRVLDQLFYEDTAIKDEAILWDFKAELPWKPDVKLSDSANEVFELKIHEIVKDSVSFYNSYGGYLIAGVEDKSRDLIGYDKDFDCAHINRKIQSATGHSVETIYRKIEYREKCVGLLFVPKRKSPTPAMFTRSAPKGATGSQAYKQGEFYLRDRDNCRPTQSVEDYEFLFSATRRTLSFDRAALAKSMENNLPPREPDLHRLIGRDEELRQLWIWLADGLSPVKILSGLGGVGKTSIAYTFAERIIYGITSGYAKLVWVGAKKSTFSALRGAYVETQRTDFHDIESFFRTLLLELGCPKAVLDEEVSIEELANLTLEHLCHFRYLLFVDDLDTLSDGDQDEIFRLLSHIVSRAQSKALITARRNLGAAKTQIIDVQGLSRDQFPKFVLDKVALLKMPWPHADDSSVMDEFHQVTGGSPLFAASVLRLVSLGDKLVNALRHWKGSDGERVRDAAFSKEIGRLQANEARILLALAYLGESSAPELGAILSLSRYEVQEALDSLSKFSMATIGSDLPGGHAFCCPNTVRLISGVIEKRVPGFSSIKAECEKRQRLAADAGEFVAEAVWRCVAAMTNNDPSGAIEIAESAVAKVPKNGDLHCLLGRALLEKGGLSLGDAEDAFEKSYNLKCRKRELFDYWIKLKQHRDDWKGVCSVALLAQSSWDTCKYYVDESVAVQSLGDELVRSGHLEEAAKCYQDGIEKIKITLHTKTIAGKGDLRVRPETS